ncbi:MAG TPA: Swt1 family HEPN domain-containing protein [Solirubrobacteraceae bacterium]|nr:Swt1 family HEPN domain-containing protein [Solirubrobacteraceae bacterium]
MTAVEDIESAILVFAMRNQMLEHELDQVEERFAVDLERGLERDGDSPDSYYPQIEASIRREAAAMAPHYEVFYSLEKTARALVADTLADEDPDWWSNLVSPQVRTDAEARKQREVDTGITPRSDDPIDFTTFGELGQIILLNWGLFGQTFSSKKAVERVTANLNTLRAPIAHCSPLADDEIVRLRLAVRDWFRLQG